MRNIIQVSPKLELPLDIVFADCLPQEFTAPDELVEGVIVNGGASVLYGDSNSGKTFFAIDMACCIARGVDWFEKKTEQGVILYLAAESPVSVRSRLQAYQQYYNVRIPNFAIVQNPIDLFSNDASTCAIIHTVKLLEDHMGAKVRLVVGDTLSRMSAGANENLGQDMSVVIKHFDNVRNVCDAHFMLIHHCGKNIAAGMRGWSGVRAAVDTEIEVTASLSRHCAVITKQRDLSTKGELIGFELTPVELGVTKWGKPASSCIVVPSDAQLSSTSSRPRAPSGKQRIIFGALEPLFRESRSYGKGGAPETKACLDYVFAVEQTKTFYPCEPGREKERTKEAIAKLVAKGFLMFKDNWLWCP